MTPLARFTGRPGSRPGSKFSEALTRFVTFFRQSVSAPGTTGAVIPSSEALARLIAAQLPARARMGGYVVELGPGTGAITETLLHEGVKPDHLIAVELNDNFLRTLGARFGTLNVVLGDAGELPAILGAADFPVPLEAAAVVSSLPLRSMSADTHRRILKAVFSQLASDGSMIQFTYGPLPPVSSAVLRELGLTAARCGMTWRNFPPASVWRITRG